MSKRHDQKKSLTVKISECFLNGLIVILPPAITIFVVAWILNLTEGTLGAMINQYLETDYMGVGLIAIVVFIWAVGFITGNNFAQQVIEFIEILLDKIPVVKFIYGSVKQFSKAIFESNSAFKCVVLVPENKTWRMGFLMTNVPNAVREKLGVDYVCVFLPWSLNMTSGTNIFVRRQDIIVVNMKPEEALQFILTAGTVAKK